MDRLGNILREVSSNTSTSTLLVPPLCPSRPAQYIYIYVCTSYVLDETNTLAKFSSKRFCRKLVHVGSISIIIGKSHRGLFPSYRVIIRVTTEVR